MPIVRNIADGGSYQPQPGERLLQLQNTGDTQLYLGIRNGDYMLAPPAGEAQVTYVLVQEQWVRLQQQLKLQPTYKNWIASGLLTLVEVAELPVPEPEPEAEPPTEPPATEPEPPTEPVVTEPPAAPTEPPMTEPEPATPTEPATPATPTEPPTEPPATPTEPEPTEPPTEPEPEEEDAPAP